MARTITTEHEYGFTDRAVISLWHLLAKMWYPVLTRMTRNVSVSFLNYGFNGDQNSPDLPKLQRQDESDRVCIQLYDHVTRGIHLAGKSVLEVSCGHGGGASYLARYRDTAAVHAIDRNPHAIRLCKRRHKMQGLTFSCGNAMALNFASESFDVVVNIEASHCYADLSHFFREVTRVLKPGGYFLYADFRQSHPDHAMLHRKVELSDLECISQENISHDVVRGMELNSDRNLAMIRRLVPKPLVKPAMNFAGSKGSGIYEALASGKTTYFFYVLRKSV